MCADWHVTGSLAEARRLHTATLLLDGRVLVVGGYSSAGAHIASAEIYDPAIGTWSPAGTLAIPRGAHSAALLPDGRVLVAGGYYRPTPTTSSPTASAEIYDPNTGSWAMTGSMSTPRHWHTATALPGGAVLVAGGWASVRSLRPRSSTIPLPECGSPQERSMCRVTGTPQTSCWTVACS
jgi:hypothetical protein